MSDEQQQKFHPFHMLGEEDPTYLTEKEIEWAADVFVSITSSFVRQLSDAGFVQPFATVEVYDDGRTRLFAFGQLTDKYGDGRISKSMTIHPGDSALDEINQLSAWIDEQDTPLEIAQRSVRSKLSDLIDEAQRCDMPVEFVNPLIETMRSLSENIIEDQT